MADPDNEELIREFDNSFVTVFDDNGMVDNRPVFVRSMLGQFRRDRLKPEQVVQFMAVNDVAAQFSCCVTTRFEDDVYTVIWDERMNGLSDFMAKLDDCVGDEGCKFVRKFICLLVWAGTQPEMKPRIWRKRHEG
ncbi:TPA: hypothetical protein DF272_04585 [Candidatus Falkowbacteria bacterium]|nr:hypothetical protein [Candidatus Falkowbacteria bacterium]